MTQLQLMLISAHPLWGQLCHDRVAHHLQGFRLHLLISQGVMEPDVLRIKGILPNILLVSLNLPYSGLTLIRALKSSDCHPAIIILCSHDALPRPSEVEDLHLAGIVPSSASPDALIAEIRAVATNRPAPYLQQYLRHAHDLPPPTRKPSTLTDQDCAILQLVAQGFKDREIADALSLSMRTVQTYLSRVYEKLAVRGRTAAVLTAKQRGLI